MSYRNTSYRNTSDERLTFDRHCPTCEARPGEPCEVVGTGPVRMVQGFHKQRWEARYQYQYADEVRAT